jgi:hypothetical protein
MKISVAGNETMEYVGNYMKMKVEIRGTIMD